VNHAGGFGVALDQQLVELFRADLFARLLAQRIVAGAAHTIARGAQNLPGNWESTRFKLPDRIREAIPRIGDHETMVVMHNDAVVQGLSELPYAQRRKHWGVLTIGTGLGNASFSTRHLD
jgi:hypothetical protein